MADGKHLLLWLFTLLSLATAASCREPETVGSQVQPLVQRTTDVAPEVGDAPPANSTLAADSASSADTEPLLDFLERPTAGADPSAQLPMIVALHGLGDRPEAFGHLFDGFPAPVRLILPRAPEAWGKGWSWFPLGPAPDFESGLLRSAERIARLVKELRRQRPTSGAVIVTGFSQGGMLSFTLAARYPEMFSLAVPVAGLLPASLRTELAVDAADERRRVTPGLVAYHGELDERVPLLEAERTVQAFVSAGFEAELRPWPDTGHSIPESMRRDYLSLLVESVAVARAALPTAVGSLTASFPRCVDRWPLDAFPVSSRAAVSSAVQACG